MKIAITIAAVLLAAGVAHAKGTTTATAPAAPAKPVEAKPAEAKPKKAAVDEFAGVRVIYADANALWSTDARGKGTATKLLDLSGEALALRSDPAGRVLVVNVGGVWSWLATDAASPSLAALPCTADGGLSITADAEYVVCGSGSGSTQLVRLRTGAKVVRAVPSASAVLVGPANARVLMWGDADGVWSALAKRKDDLANKKLLAPAPLRGLSIRPDGARALGVFAGIQRKGKTETATELLYGFALDGTAARRKSIRGGVVVQWSADGAWALVQDGTKACVMRVVGGEYKCWKGYQGVALSPDGESALLLGSPKASGGGGAEPDDSADPGGDGEGGGGGGDDEPVAEPAAEATPTPAVTGERALYRARVPGTYTAAPAMIVGKMAGAAAWLPAPVAAAPAATP